MAKMRVYELAKELGVENKIIIAKAQDLGYSSVRSHSNSLDPDEADALRRSFIREAIGTRPDVEIIKTRVDETGQTSTIVERRKGDVVRRRQRPSEKKSSADSIIVRRRATEESAPVAEAPVENIVEEQTAVSEKSEGATALKAADALFQDKPVAVEDTAAESPVEEIEQVAADAVEADVAREEESAVDAAVEEETTKTVGPKILGRIELPQKRVKPKLERAVKAPARTVVFKEAEPEEEDSDDDRKRGGKKRGKRSRKRELSVGDLVDYERRGVKGGKRSRGKKGRDEEQQAFDAAQEAGPTRASKRVVKMAGEAIQVGELASQLSVKAGEVIAKLIELGVMATINQSIDQDTATLVADEFGFTLEFTGFDETDILGLVAEENVEGTLESRPPVVTVMGHVDHGKTSLLDFIRSSTVATKEHGGITQHIGAYHVELKERGMISFVDTPGHAAFTQMRARGAQITDIVILVVAADDGVMPQTVEALNHAKAAGVPIIVAVNKIDKPDANPDRPKQQLSDHGLIAEDWGGDTMFFPVSALTGQGIDELLEGVLLLAEIKELKASPNSRVRGTIIEARQEIGRGTVATVLVQSGTLKVGDIFVAGAEYGRVRSMVDYVGNRLETAGPSMPVEITGLNGIPTAGDDFIVVEEEVKAREVASRRAEHIRHKEALNLGGGPISLEEFARMAQQEEVAELNLIVKADVQGSLEAVIDATQKASTDKVKVKVVHGAVGGVNESDVQLAIASKALIVGFGVRGEPRALTEAENKGIEVRFYRIIYELIDDVKGAMAGLLAPIKKEVHLGRAEVRDTFSVPKIGMVAGCYVTDGNIKRGSKLRLLRDSIVVYEGKMLNLRRFKEDVKEVQSGYECGISIDGYNDIKTGDVIEAFEIKEEAATLE